MQVLGLEVKPIKQKVRVHCALLEGTFSSPSLVDEFQLNSSLGSIAERAYDVSSSLSSHLQGLDVATVVVRRAEVPPKASNADGPRDRLIIEGALVAFARHKVVDSRLERGRVLAQSRGLSKDELDALGAAVANADYVAAAAAAIAVLS